MTILVTTQVCCEHDNCVMVCDVEGNKAGAREVRKLAKKEGWSRVGGRDYCPSHKPTYKRVLVPAG